MRLHKKMKMKELKLLELKYGKWVSWIQQHRCGSAKSVNKRRMKEQQKKEDYQRRYKRNS